MTTANQIDTLAESAGVDAGSVRWLADYLVRQADGREDLINNPEWIAEQVRNWLTMANEMTEAAFNNPDLASRAVLDQVRKTLQRIDAEGTQTLTTETTADRFFVSTHNECGGENVTRGNKFPYLRCHRCGSDYYQSIDEASGITHAEAFAKLLDDDGQCFEARDGRSFGEVADDLGAGVEVYRSDPDDGEPYQVPRADGTTSDRYRYVFPDGSAIVDHCDGWDIEGDAPGTWRG